MYQKSPELFEQVKKLIGELDKDSYLNKYKKFNCTQQHDGKYFIFEMFMFLVADDKELAIAQSKEVNSFLKIEKWDK